MYNFIEEEVAGNNVLVRVDFNVPIDKAAKSGLGGYLAANAILDDGRIRAALPTIQRLVSYGAKVVLVAHLGRPIDGAQIGLSLRPVADRLSELLGESVQLLSVPSETVLDTFAQLGPGRIGLVENVRFDPRETSKIESERQSLAKELARGADLFVSDGFGVLHRQQASVTEIAAFLPARAGLLVAAEVDAFDQVLTDPKRPYVVILGGAKVSDKIGVIRNLLNRADTLLIGGAMAFTFLRAQGIQTGQSLVEEDKIAEARALLDLAGLNNVRIFLPADVIVAQSVEMARTARKVPVTEMPAAEIGLDIGPATVAIFADQIRNAQTLVWNGPMGVFEKSAFSNGTRGVAEAVADCPGFTVIGGGDTAAAIRALGLDDDRFSFVSTGGGATLELLEGKKLPGLSILALSESFKNPTPQG